MTSVDKQATGLVEIGDGVFAIIYSFGGVTAGGPHSGFIVAGDHLLIIDSLMLPSQASDFQAQIAKVTSKRPTFLVNSHHHQDHVSGNQFFSPPAQVIAHSYVRHWMLENGEAAVQGMARSIPEASQIRITPPSVTFDEKLTLHLDGVEVQLMYFGPAHTFGDIVVYLPQQKVLYAVDVGVTKMVPFLVDGHSAGWISLLDKVQELDVDVVVPGHGFLGDKSDLANLRDYLAELRRQVKDRFENGMDEEQAVKDVDVRMHKDWSGQGTLPIAIRRIYQELSGELD